MIPQRFIELTSQIGRPDLARPAYLLSVITVHGVLTTGKWQKDFATIASDNLIRVESVDYSYRFPTLRPNRRAEAASQEFVQRYMDQRHWKLPTSAIGHSFGTFVIGRTLELNPHLKLERLILSASILARSFPWSDIVSIGRVKWVMNEHCPKDRVVPLSQSWQLLGSRTGISGNRGFRDLCSGAVANVHYTHVGHNKLITKLHMEEAWLPFLLHGKVPHGDPKPNAKSWLWWKN